jgi:alpha-beta hydrolase superfamily lysophospholipase
LYCLLDQLEIAGPVVLVGHSFGGNIVKMFASDYPDRVAGIVFADGSLARQRLWFAPGPLIDGDLPQSTEVDTIAGEVELLTASLPRVPVAVLTSRAVNWQQKLPHPAIDKLWLAHQRILARELNAPLVIAPRASHQLQYDVPDLVAYLIRAVRASALDGGIVDIDGSAAFELSGELAGAL